MITFSENFHETEEQTISFSSDSSQVIDSKPVSLNILSPTLSTSAEFVIPIPPSRNVCTPPRHILTASPPPSTVPPSRSTLPSTALSFQRQKISILEKEYRERQRRADSLHELQIKFLKEKIRKAQAQADLAEYILQKKYSARMT